MQLLMSDKRYNPDPKTDKNDSKAFAKYAAFSTTPYLLIVYPLVGFGLGYLTVYYWHWTIFVAVATMILGLIQGIREVVKMGENLNKDKH
jgi:F0F1-type ATP synthase assembly protein I